MLAEKEIEIYQHKLDNIQSCGRLEQKDEQLGSLQSQCINYQVDIAKVNILLAETSDELIRTAKQCQ